MDVSWRTRARRFIDEFHTDMRLLGCLDPDMQPRATQHIGAMIATIQRIIEHGHAYAVDGGDVFFDVASMPDYGRLSGRQQVFAVRWLSQRAA